MWWRKAQESNPHPGRSQSAGFRDQKTLPSLRALRWSESRDSNLVRAVLRTAASTTSASPTWHTREELNPESQFWRLLPSPSGRVCNWWACSESNREKQPLLRRPAVPIYLCHRPETWSAGRDSNSQAPRSERGDFTDLSTRGWYPGSDSNAQTQPPQGCDFTDLSTRIWCAR